MEVKEDMEVQHSRVRGVMGDTPQVRLSLTQKPASHVEPIGRRPEFVVFAENTFVSQRITLSPQYHPANDKNGFET